MKKLYDISTKPYYGCLSCPDFRTVCGGMPTRGLDLKEWCERIRDTMDYIGLSCAYVAKEADVSQRTVERIHAVNIDQDIMRSTARRIEIVVFGQATRLICKMDYDTTATEKIAQLQAENATLREDLARERKENDRKAKIIDEYLERKERYNG